MKLLKKEAERIVDLYNLGDLISFKLNLGGAVNYNFDFVTTEGEFMVKVLSVKMNKHSKEKLRFEMDFMSYLDEKNFPYDFPRPIKNKKGNFLFKFGANYLWVYRKIPGEVVYNFSNVKEIAKVLATFHKFSRRVKVPSKMTYHFVEFLCGRYEEIKKKLSKIPKPTNVDKIVISNFDLFYDSLMKVKKMNFKKNLIVTHSDFGNHNLLFEKNKVKAILDFENLSLNPRIREISYPMKRLCFNGDKIDRRKWNLFLKEYEKMMPLTKKEKEMVLPMMILDSCNVFWWVYMEMKKNVSKKAHFLNKAIEKMKYLVSEVGWS